MRYGDIGNLIWINNPDFFMAINGANNVSITLQLTLTSSATTLILPTGKGGLLSGATPPLRGVIEEYDDAKNVVKREIVSITAISGDQLTITRAVEACPIADSASAQQQVSQVFATPTKTKISVAMTKGMLDDINDSISNLASDKLNALGELRTGLTPNRVIATNGAGEEIAVGGSAGQVLGFGAGGAPEAVSPTVDIAGLPTKTAPVGADKLIIGDSQASGVNKKIDVASLFSPFGNGSDGDVTISTNTTLVRDMYYRNLTINSTIVLNPNGYRIYVAGTLTNNGIIRRNGNPGNNSTSQIGGLAGATLNQGSLNAESAAGNGSDSGNGLAGASSNPSYTTINGVPGGGNQSYSGGVGGVSVRGALYNIAYSTMDIVRMLCAPSSYLSTVVSTQYKGPSGSGGGAGQSYTGGGGAGSNGGTIWIAARIYNGTSGIIEAIGGNGGSGGSYASYGGGGGGGGQGGLVVLIYETLIAIGTVTLTGGAGGASGGGLGGSVNGTNGNVGVVIQIPITL